MNEQFVFGSESEFLERTHRPPFTPLDCPLLRMDYTPLSWECLSGQPAVFPPYWD